MARGVMARLREAEQARGSGDLLQRADRLARTGGPLSAVHQRTVDVLAKLVRLAVSMTGDETPTHLRVLVTMLDKSRPLLLDGLAKVPDDQVIAFMTEIRDDCQSIIDAGQEVSGGAADDAAQLEPAGNPA